jgi:transcriptional regulator
MDLRFLSINGRRRRTPLDSLEERAHLPSDHLEERVADDRSELLQGTLELLVLKALSLEPMHGWGIGQRIDQFSRDVFRVHQGSLYPALQRMLRKGLVRSEWRTSDHNRRARYYLLTAAGKRQLAVESAEWARASEAVNAILRLRLADGA